MTDTAKPKRARKSARAPKDDAPAEGEAHSGTDKPVTAHDAPAAKPESKTARVLALLQRPEGATLEEMVAATGWLPHTTRAALTGLKKKGHAITSEKVDSVRRYRADTQ